MVEAAEAYVLAASRSDHGGYEAKGLQGFVKTFRGGEGDFFQKGALKRLFGGGGVTFGKACHGVYGRYGVGQEIDRLRIIFFLFQGFLAGGSASEETFF